MNLPTDMPMTERALIAGLFIVPDDFERVRELITPDDFADPRFGSLFAFMVELGTSDYSTVHDEGRRRGLLSEDACVELLTMARGPMEHPIGYARRLRLNTKRREAGESVEALAVLVRDSAHPDELRSALAGCVDSVRGVAAELDHEERLRLRALGGEGVAA